MFRVDHTMVVNVGSSRTNRTIMNLSKNKKFRNSIHMPNIGAIKKSNFLTPNAKKAFNHLRLVFIKALIFRHFDLQSHI